MRVVDARPLDVVNIWFPARTLLAVLADIPDERAPPSLIAALVEQLESLHVPPYLSGAGGRLQTGLPAGAGWVDLVGGLVDAFHFVCCGFTGARAVRPTVEKDGWILALVCEQFGFTEACLSVTLKLCIWLRSGESIDCMAVYSQLLDIKYDLCYARTTATLINAARRRGIPVYPLNEGFGSLLQLGEGARQRRISKGTTSRTGYLAEQISTDKAFVKTLWSRLGIPVAPGRLVANEDDAVCAAEAIGWPVVVKPSDSDWGLGVSMQLKTPNQVREAYRKARTLSEQVIVERNLQGLWHRLLIVDDRLIAALRREVASVEGDGRHTVSELVKLTNQDPRRGPDSRWPLHWMVLGELELAYLEATGFAPDSIPALGQEIVLRPIAHTDAGSTSQDVTAQVHPETRDLARDAVRVVGLDVAGIDMVAADISRPLGEQGGGFLEINAFPALFLHLEPISIPPHPIDETIIESLFPTPADGRVPLFVALGEGLADRVVDLTARRLERDGLHAASSNPRVTQFDGRPLGPKSARPAERLHTMTLHPRTEAAALSVPWADIIREGLGTDRCDVLVLANGPKPSDLDGGDHDGLERLIRQLEAMARRIVINLDDPIWADFPIDCGHVTVLVASDPDEPRLVTHLARGYSAAFLRGSEILFLTGADVVARFDTVDWSAAHGEKDYGVARCLAAAAWFVLN